MPSSAARRSTPVSNPWSSCSAIRSRALPAREEALGPGATQGNAAIAASLARHIAGQGATADALYDSPSGPVQMGAAWGAADAALRSRDNAALEKLFTSDNDNVRRGLG